MSGYVKIQNCRYRAPNNPHKLHHRPLRSVKVTSVMCSFFSLHFWSLFENATRRIVTECGAVHRVMPAAFLRSELHPRKQHLSWFQQDGATAHTAQISIRVLSTVFPGRLISRFEYITWPARSPDFAVPDYFFWGCVKSKVYESRPVNIDDVKQRTLFKVYLERVLRNWKRKCQPMGIPIQNTHIYTHLILQMTRYC